MVLRKSVKLLPPDALIFSSKCVWRLGSTRTRWGSLSAPPDPLAAKRGPTSKGRGREGKGGERRGKKGRGGKGGVEGREREGRGRKGALLISG